MSLTYQEVAELAYQEVLENPEAFKDRGACRVFYRRLERIYAEAGIVTPNELKLLRPAAEAWLQHKVSLWPKCARYKDGRLNLQQPVGGMDEYFEYYKRVWDNPLRHELMRFIISQE